MASALSARTVFGIVVAYFDLLRVVKRIALEIVTFLDNAPGPRVIPRCWLRRCHRLARLRGNK